MEIAHQHLVMELLTPAKCRMVATVLQMEIVDRHLVMDLVTPAPKTFWKAWCIDDIISSGNLEVAEDEFYA